MFMFKTSVQIDHFFYDSQELNIFSINYTSCLLFSLSLMFGPYEPRVLIVIILQS